MTIAPSKCAGLYLFGAVWLIYGICPPFLSYDSYWSTATAVELIEHRDTEVDRLVSTAPRESWYGLECVPTGGEATHSSPASGCPGHWYSLYPIGVPVLVTPLLLLMKAVAALAAPLTPHTGFFARPEVAAWFAGDFIGGRPLTELWCASTIGALAVWTQYRVALLVTRRSVALIVALLFAFGTSEWSIASRNLFPHGLTTLLLSGAIYFILRARAASRLSVWAGLLLALAVTVRPSNVISFVVLMLFLWRGPSGSKTRATIPAAAVLAAYAAYYLIVHHSLIPLYVKVALLPYPWFAGAAMHLFSPSRGLLIFTPLVLVSGFGAIVALRRGWCAPLSGYLIAIVALHSILIFGAWPGHGYGPRFFADLTHIFAFFWIPAIEWWREQAPRPVWAAAAFCVLAAWSVFVHARGGASIAANQWSALPINVDRARWRVWDYSDPQFLRGLK